MEGKKSVVIVGPGEHFGHELARRFGNEGHHIVLVARTEAVLQELQKHLVEQGISSEIVVADVADTKTFQETIAKHTLKDVAGLIFNVKASPKGNGLMLPPEELTKALQTNVSGVVTAIQAFLPRFVPNASVMLTGGGYKDTPDSQKLALSVSKGALHTLFLSLIAPLAERNIKIGTVVIDGVVREEGPIFPGQVVDAFVDLFHSETGKVVMVSGR